MAEVTYATNRWPCDGATTQRTFSFSGGYIDKAHVRAFIEDSVTRARISEVTITPSMWADAYTLTGLPAGVAGQNHLILRDTPKNLPLVDFISRSRITEASLDKIARQAVFSAAETADATNADVVATIASTAGVALTAASTATTKASEAAASASAAATDAASAASANLVRGNRIVNGGMLVNQEAATYTSTDRYTLDQWVVGSTGAAVTTTQAGKLSGAVSSRSMQITGAAGVTDVGFSQRMLAIDTQDMAGQQVTLSLLVFQNTGVTKTPNLQVLYANAANNFSGTTLAATAQAVSIPSGIVTRVSATFVLSASAITGLLADFSSFGVLGAGTSLFVTDVALRLGTINAFEQEDYASTLRRCQVFAQSSYNTGSYVGSIESGIQYAASSTAGEAAPVIMSPVRMWTSPSAVTVYSPATGAAGSRRNLSAAVDEAITGFNVSTAAFHCGATAGHTAGNVYGYHFFKTARL